MFRGKLWTLGGGGRGSFPLSSPLDETLVEQAITERKEASEARSPGFGFR